jgi:hypothetical protein
MFPNTHTRQPKAKVRITGKPGCLQVWRSSCTPCLPEPLRITHHAQSASLSVCGPFASVQTHTGFCICWSECTYDKTNRLYDELRSVLSMGRPLTIYCSEDLDPGHRILFCIQGPSRRQWETAQLVAPRGNVLGCVTSVLWKSIQEENFPGTRAATKSTDSGAQGPDPLRTSVSLSPQR